MSRKMQYKIAIDCMMTAGLLGLMAYSLLGEAAHEWIGVGMLVLFILHHLLNLPWLKSIGKGSFTLYRTVQTLLVILIFLTMMGSMISGVFISQHVFDFLPLASDGEMARLVHLCCGYWNFVLMNIHLGLHWRMILGIFQNKICISGIMAEFLRAFGFLIAIYGVFVFYKEDIVAYLFLQTHFVLIDFTKTLAIFWAEYLAMMGTFISFGYYLGKALQKQRKGARTK